MIPRSPLASLLLAVALAGCAGAPPAVADTDADLLLLGERHDDPAHQRAHRDAVRSLVARGRLAAVVLEMADEGTSTAALPPDAGEDAVRSALRWNEPGWPWAPYAPAIMEAVRSRVPVLGGNLARERLRGAMGDAALDTALDRRAMQAQREAVRTGHCDLLPASQLGPMARVQVARDQALARTLERAAVPGKTVLLLAGANHVDAAVGVRRHLPPALRVRAQVWPESGEAPATDHCAELREQWRHKPAS